MSRLDLMPEGPVARVDRALALVRHGSGYDAFRAIFGGALVALVVLGAFWIERVEGVFEVRPLIAALLVLAFAARSVLAVEVTQRYVRGLWDAVEIPEDAGRPMAVARTATLVTLGLSLWGVILLSATVVGPFAIGFVFPLLAVRGLNAPGWLARVACTPDRGWTALRNAFADNAQQRGENVTVEFLLSLATLGLAINLLALLTFCLLLMRSMLGIDLALLDQFLSSRNTFFLLAAGLTALVLLEPLRLALSAIVFVDARVRSEGLDVRAAIDSAVAHADKRRRGRAAAAITFLVVLFGAQPLRAQAPEPDAATHDAEVQERASHILADPAYREFSDARGRGLREMIDRWLGNLLHPDEDTNVTAPTGPGLPLPGPAVFIVIGVIFAVLIALYLLLNRSARLPEVSAPREVKPKAEDPRDRAPEAWVDEAGKLAAEGRYRDALRALYLATLVALDRRQAITFDPTLTNWQYLRQLAGSDLRADFRSLTRIFDHKWYGLEDTSEGDYRTCRELAERLVARAGRPDPLSERGAST